MVVVEFFWFNLRRRREDYNADSLPSRESSVETNTNCIELYTSKCQIVMQNVVERLRDFHHFGKTFTAEKKFDPNFKKKECQKTRAYDSRRRSIKVVNN